MQPSTNLNRSPLRAGQSARLPLSNRGVGKTERHQTELARATASASRTWAGIDWVAGSVDLFDLLEAAGWDGPDDWSGPGISELLESFGPRARKKGDDADQNGELVTARLAAFVPPPALVHEIAASAFQFLFGGTGLVLSKDPRPGKFYAFRWLITNVWDEVAGMIELGGQLTLRKGGRPSLRFELTGLGCAIYECRADASADHAQRWCALAAKLQAVRAQLSRVDIAFDDFDGIRNLELARTMWQLGEFDYKFAGELHRPKARSLDDHGSGEGSTFYVGHSSSEKQLRVYEKGKQLGDRESKWTRWELQMRSSTRRALALDVLRDPLAFMRGAFACLDWVSSCMARLEVTHEATKACVKSVMRHAKRMYGATLRHLHQLAPTDGDVFQLLHYLGEDRIPRWAKTGRIRWDHIAAILNSPTGESLGDLPITSTKECIQ